MIQESGGTPNDPGRYRIRVLRSADEFAAVRDAWDALFNETVCTTASISGAAVFAFLKHRIASGEQPVVAIAEAHGGLLGGLPAVARSTRVGTVLESARDIETTGLLLRSGCDGLLAMELVEALFAGFPRPYALRFRNVSAHSDAVRAILRSSRHHCHADVDAYGSFLQLCEVQADVLSMVSNNFRKNLRKQRRRLDALSNVHFEFLEGAEADPSVIEDFIALEQAGWKGRVGRAIGHDPAMTAYYRTLVKELAREQRLEWHLLTVGGKLIAAHLGIRTGRAINLLKIAYDESYAAAGPGNMLLLELIRREQARDREAVVDCLTDMPWHRNWRMASRPYLTVTLFPRRLLPTVLGYYPRVVADVLRGQLWLRSLVRTVKARWRRSANSSAPPERSGETDNG
jgi:CelD/BcsL family acetyltransferase involved in cellulose biosynthesis